MRGGAYADSEIVRLKKHHRRLFERFDLETDTVPIREEQVRFAYRELFNGKARMLLPETFAQMPEELARLRYLSEHRPRLILTGKNPTENIGISCVARDGRDLQEALTMMRDAVRQSTPESAFYESGEIAANDLEGYWFEYKSFTINAEAYNLQFLLASKQTILLGVFNCCIRHFEDWKPFIIKLLAYTKIFDGRAL